MQLVKSRRKGMGLGERERDEKQEWLRERRRRRFIRRARAGKRVWLSRCLRNFGGGKRQKAVLGRGMQVVLWLLLGAVSLGVSGFLAICTGENKVLWVREARAKGEAENWLEEAKEDGAGGMEEGWEKEFLGVHIRFKEGQLSIFREKEQMKRSTN
ncbi:MAG: hypothetical protein HFG47_11400 [Lachnospiraceae bacterium]|nr:hypothetical protein [Lachnospiraceae bacterium]